VRYGNGEDIMKDKKHVIWAQYTDKGKLVETVRCSTDVNLGAIGIWKKVKNLIEAVEKFGS